MLCGLIITPYSNKTNVLVDLNRFFAALNNTYKSDRTLALWIYNNKECIRIED